MNTTDIRILVSFRGHRKRKRLRSILGPDSTDYLLDLWLATAMNHPSGELVGMDEVDIALEAGWEGDAGEFVRALISCRLLDVDADGTYSIHDWPEHQPYVCAAPERSERARHAAGKRWGKERDAAGMPEACGEHAECNAPSPYPSPYPTKEKKVAPTDKNPSVESPPPPPRRRGAMKSGIVLTGEYTWEGVTEKDRARWALAYPACNLDVELAKAAEYIRAHPEKRKRNWLSYIVRWLARTQEHGGSKISPSNGGSPAESSEAARARRQREMEEQQRKFREDAESREESERRYREGEASFGCLSEEERKRRMDGIRASPGGSMIGESTVRLMAVYQFMEECQ